LELVPVGERPRVESTLAWTLSFFRPYRARVAGLAALSLAEIALRALAPWPLKVIVDRLVAPSAAPIPLVSRVISTASPSTMLLAIVGIGIALQLGHELVLLVHTRVQAGLAQRIVFDLRSRVFAHLQYLSLSAHSQMPTADAVYRLDADSGCLENLLLRGLFPLVFSALTLIVMFGLLIRLDAALAVAALLVVPFLYVSLRVYMHRMRSHADTAKALESALVGRVHESLSSIHLVKTFAREEHELERFSGFADNAMRARMGVVDQESRFSFFVGAITMCGSSIVLAIGGLHVLRGTLSIGTLLAITAYLGFVYGPLSAIATTTGSLQQALASARRVREVLGMPRESPHEEAGFQPSRLRGEVQFEDVTFSYGPGRPVLNHVSFTVKPGETVALVGPSGAGKTTLVGVIGRLHQPASGRVLIDGVDARRFRLRSLREQIAVVLQETVLLSGSIADNILYGRLDASDHEVVLAARAAQCEEFIAGLRRGFDTPLGDAGAGLSGGQRQRISIARAFLKDAPILILDEPTASLDTIAEQGVLGALARLRTGRTTFVIAHRLSSVRDADRILVLDAGALVAEGRHEELLASSPLYRQLCTQLEPDVDSSARRPSTGERRA
jgi:ATP-binding cassette, subfamily B, bacterial